MRWLLAALALELLLGADKPGAEVDKKGKDMLQGTWVGVSAQRNGKPDDKIEGHLLTFAGDKFVIKKGGKVLYQGTYQTDPDKEPATIDFHHSEGILKGKTWKGIYALDGDTLKECDNAPDLDKGRPTEFAARADSGHVFIMFKRAKTNEATR